MDSKRTRRRFLKELTVGAGLIAAKGMIPGGVLPVTASADSLGRKTYTGPNVIVIRFGGGVRRRETIDPDNTYCPYFCKELSKKGTLFTNMEISYLEGVETSHGQGTLYILTGKYEKYKDFEEKFLGARFEAPVPTFFEYFRKTFNMPEHQTLIINGEDRTDEEFYSFSNHHLFGVKYKSNVLSLYRYKIFLLQKQLEEGMYSGDLLIKKQKEHRAMEVLDYRTAGEKLQSPEVEGFWEDWRRYYGESGLVNPRGDRLLTELSIRTMKQLRPRLLMVNYNDPDYVHWGYSVHYTNAISVIDKGIQQIVETADADPFYRGNTVFVIVPDCGRDTNRFVSVPFQHHFGSKTSHEIFALIIGPGIAKGQVVDKKVDQISIAATIGQIMGFPTEFTEGPVLSEVFT